MRGFDPSPGVLVGLAIAAVVLLFLLLSSLFTVHQTQQALVLQFGNPVRVVQEPGLHMKVPFVQQVEYFEKRVLDFDAPSVELVLGDQKRLVVDAFARYRINDALRFRQSVGSETAFRGRLEPIIFSSLRSVLGEAPLFTAALARSATQIMNRIRARGEPRAGAASASSWSTCASSAPTCRPRTARRSTGGCRPSATARPRSCGRKVPRSASASGRAPTASGAC